LGDLPIFGASDIDALSCPEPNLQKINAPQNNYKPENALNASRIVFVPSLIPEGVLVHQTQWRAVLTRLGRCSVFLQPRNQGAGQLGEGKIELLTHMVNNAISFLLAESPQSGPFAV
jgi:hypothetical protein